MVQLEEMYAKIQKSEIKCSIEKGGQKKTKGLVYTRMSPNLGMCPKLPEQRGEVGIYPQQD